MQCVDSSKVQAFIQHVEDALALYAQTNEKFADGSLLAVSLNADPGMTAEQRALLKQYFRFSMTVFSSYTEALVELSTLTHSLKAAMAPVPEAVPEP